MTIVPIPFTDEQIRRWTTDSSQYSASTIEPRGTTMLKVTLTPDLNATQKQELERWLTRVLAMENFEGENIPRTLDKVLVVYHTNRPYVLTRGSWQESWPYLYAAGSGNGDSYPIAKRLAVLITLCQLIESPALTEAASKAISKFLLGQFNTLKTSLVVSAVPHTGIAFSETATAACLNGEWMSPSGEIIDVSGEGWTVCMAPELMPVAEVVSSSERAFAVGDRVRFTHVPGVRHVGAGEGVIESLENNDGTYSVVTSTGDHWDFTREDLTLVTLDPTRPFAVGDRVLWTPHPDRDPDYEPGEGVIDHSSGENWVLRMVEGYLRDGERVRTIYAISADLSHLD
jgi:hypothetical protein